VNKGGRGLPALPSAACACVRVCVRVHARTHTHAQALRVWETEHVTVLPTLLDGHLDALCG